MIRNKNKRNWLNPACMHEFICKRKAKRLYVPQSTNNNNKNVMRRKRHIDWSFWYNKLQIFRVLCFISSHIVIYRFVLRFNVCIVLTTNAIVYVLKKCDYLNILHALPYTYMKKECLVRTFFRKKEMAIWLAFFLFESLSEK